MKLCLLVLALPFLVGCAITPNVDTRKPGQPWNYYGDLTSVYQDQTGGARVALVWLEQVQFNRVERNQFQKTIQIDLGQGYRKIGIVAARSPFFIDPYEAKKLAADKGANLVVGCWFTPPGARVNGQTRDYWYQLLYRSPNYKPPPPRPPRPAPQPAARHPALRG
jgi:hypothetical protein